MKTNNQLVIIRKIEKYIEYMITILIKFPRTEKFSIGTEIKTSMYFLQQKLKKIKDYNITMLLIAIFIIKDLYKNYVQ